MNGRKKPGAKNFSVSLDLTKRRYALLAKANKGSRERQSLSCIRLLCYKLFFGNKIY